MYFNCKHHDDHCDRQRDAVVQLLLLYSTVSLSQLTKPFKLPSGPPGLTSSWWISLAVWTMWIPCATETFEARNVQTASVYRCSGTVHCRMHYSFVVPVTAVQYTNSRLQFCSAVELRVMPEVTMSHQQQQPQSWNQLQQQMNCPRHESLVMIYGYRTVRVKCTSES